jgi:hypothetical protein
VTGRPTLGSRLAVLAVSAASGVATVTLGSVAPAGALPILETADATELAQALAEATEDQDVCYGWKVTVYDYGGGADGIDQGSSLGVGQTAIQTQCPRYVVFDAYITYTSSASEAEDSASFDVVSNIPGAPTAADLRGNGVSGGGLLGAHDDEVVANATLLLPALMAEKGLAEPISLEANTQPLPASDRATGTPGSDWLRKYGAAVAIAALMVLAGLGWAAWIVVKEHPFTRAPVPTTSRRKRSGGLHQ